MRINYIDFGEIIAWIAMIALFAFKLVSFEIFILFVLLKLKIRLEFRHV